MTKTRHLEAHITPWAQFHAYVLSNLIGIRWGKITPTSGMGNNDLGDIVREYLEYVAGKDEWKKQGILDAMRDKSAASIKDDTRFAFPSIFPKYRKALPFGVPEELANEEVRFDPELIESWTTRVREIKKEFTMNENVTTEEVTQAQEDSRPQATTPASKRQTKVNFVVPSNVDLDDMTLENYRDVTGARFRMTKDQKERGLSREEAFAESKTLAVKQLGGE